MQLPFQMDSAFLKARWTSFQRTMRSPDFGSIKVSILTILPEDRHRKAWVGCISGLVAAGR